MENLDFYNHNIFPIQIGDNQFWITTTIVNTWIIMGVLFVFAIIVRLSLKKFEDIPKGFQNVIEAIVDIFYSFTSSTMGEKNKGFAPFYGSMFLFILLANLSGLVGLRPPTADIATTLSLALMTFFMVQGYGIKSNGIGKYIKGFFEPIPFLFPLNVIGELANPVSLSFRLFGNILGGTIIMALWYSMPWIALKIGLPAVLHAYFDVFAGVLQTFIFVMLSMTFVSSAMEG
ncbi:F0F1 ATP synthase subunit A [Defluviitalea phaphyphila]|uniref:F0F1 ATP synthase subunit A n=1 Tax=Defluviitalea phaphyphila TaxID=1473580 RepID=UPI0007DC2D25|nr:F0F1 ATP synthase subunit A [Defluviitalea phaphyphila]